MANKWIVHIKKTMKTMKSKGTYKKGLGLKQVIKEAKKSWHHAKKGGGDEGMAPVETKEEELPTAGRRKRHGKTRRHRKH
jgi:hypothetical protein